VGNSKAPGVCGVLRLVEDDTAALRKYRKYRKSQIMKTIRLLPFFLLSLLVLPLCGADEPTPKPAPHGEKPPVPKNVRNVGVDEFDKLRAK